MIPIRSFDLVLLTQSLNNQLYQTIVQGSEDTQISCTVQQDGKNIQIDTSAELELSILYNGGTTQTYHTASKDADFPAVIEADGTITIAFNEMMTTVFGVHKLFLKIKDTNTSYALELTYEVIKNEAYNPKSTPNNLPSYETILKELPLKLNKDYSNSDDVALQAKLKALGIGADETAEQIKAKLETLKADDRLDNSAIKDSLSTDLADVDLDKLDEKFQATDSGKVQRLQGAAIGTKLDTDMGNVNTSLFSREMKLTGAYQDLAKRPINTGKTPQEIKALFEANRFEEQTAVDFSDVQFSSTTLYMAYQFTSSDQTITQELPAVADNKIIMVEALLSNGVTNPTLTFTPKTGDNIQGETKPYTITGKSGYLGYFLPLQNENAWQFIPHEISHEFSLAVSDDKGNVHIGINSIEFGKSTVTEDGGILKVTPDASSGGGSSLTFVDDQSREFTGSKVQSLSKKVRIRNVGGGTVDLDANYEKSLDGVFAKLSYPEPINTDFHDQRPYFGDRYEHMGMYIGYDMQNKAFTIQEGDELDPNITGGSHFRLGFYAETLNSPIASFDGYAELKLVDPETNQYVLDDNGNPIAVRHEYKQGDVIKPEVLVASLTAKGQQKISFEFDYSFGGQIIELSDNTCIYIQTVDKEHNTGTAELIFEQKTGYNILPHQIYYGTNFMNLAADLVRTKGEEELDGQHELMGNGLFVSSFGKSKVKIENYQLTIKDNGTDLPVFSVGKLLTRRETRDLWNKNMNATVKITDKNNAFDYSLMQWSGQGEPALPILIGYQNSQPQFAAGWTKVQNKFITEDAVLGVHTDTNAFTVPDQANQVAVMIYPHVSQIPTTLILNDFELDVAPQFTKSYISKLTHQSESYLRFVDYVYRSLVKVPAGDASYSYTVNSTETRLPIGVFSGGDGKIINDNSWHDAGSSDPEKVQGNAKFKADGRVKIECSLRLKNRTPTENDVKIWFENSDGSEIIDSIYTGKIAGNTNVAKIVDLPKFTINVKELDTIKLMAQSNIDDGFYIDSTNRAFPLIKVIYDFDELTEQEKQLAEKITAIDDELVITQAALDKDAYIQLDWDDKNDRPTLTAEVR